MVPRRVVAARAAWPVDDWCLSGEENACKVPVQKAVPDFRRLLGSGPLFAFVRG
jgi:hypothetical protein